MPEITAPPAPTPAPPPATPPAPAASDVNIPDLMKLLMQDVTEEEASGDPTKKKTPAADAPPKPTEAPPAAPKPGDAPPAEPAIRVRRQKRERPVLPTIDDTPPPTPAAPAAPAPAAPSGEEAKKWESGLEENESEMLADARYLETTWPDKYKGMGAKVEKFLRDHIEFTERADFDDQDPEYRRFLESAPKLSRAEIRQIEESRIATNLRKENDTRFADIQFKTFAKEKEAELENTGRQVYGEMANSQLPDDLSTVLKEAIAKHGPQKGYEEALKTHRLEVETAEGVLTAAADDIKEFHRLNTRDPQTRRMLAEFAVDKSDPKFEQHQRLGQMVDGICDSFKNNAGEEAIRDGKWFVTRKEWLRLRPEKRGGFWTFSNAELIQRAKAGIKGVISAAIEQKHKFLKERGWSRAAASAAAPAAPPATPSPKAPPGPAPVPPGGGEPPASVSDAARKIVGAINRD